MASPQIFEDLSSVFSILLQKKSEHTFLYYPLFQDYLNLLTLLANCEVSFLWILSIDKIEQMFYNEFTSYVK